MNWKSMLFESDPNAAAPEEKPSKVASTPTPTGIPSLAGIPGLSTVLAPAQVVFSQRPTPGSVTLQATPNADQTANFLGKLRDKLATAAASGLLNSFVSTMESLVDAIPEEGNRFRAAVKVLSKQSGVTPEQLTDAYNSLIALLEAESTKFHTAVESQKAAEVDARDQQVQSLNSQIEGLMKQRDEIATAIVEAKTKLGQAATSFEGAVASLQAEVGDSLQKLRIYFPATSVAKK